MEISFSAKGRLQIDDARLIFRNFAGRATEYNSEGDRNFAVIIPNEDIASQLEDAGWNVKTYPPRDEGETPLMTLKVKISDRFWTPKFYLNSNGRVREIPFGEELKIFDNVDIISVSLDVSPSHWQRNGREGQSAYLRTIEVIQEVDRFAARYAANEE